MAQETIATLSGAVAGIIAKILTKDLMTAIFVAGLTGFAAYIGQAAAKTLHRWIQKKFFNPKT
jgi:hypothetical protein